MLYKQILSLIEISLVAFSGGYLFYLINIPLPWVLGALTFVMLWQGITRRELFVPTKISDSGFIILGIYFGLYFTTETFETILPFLFPYFMLTCFLIGVSILLGVIVTRWINIDKVTSVFASIPGGITEMTIASKSMNAQSSLVVIFQTIRLITVLFTIPPFMSFFFMEEEQVTSNQIVAETPVYEVWSYIWYILPILTSIYIKNRIPAGIIVGALGVTAIMNISPIEVGTISPIMINIAQVVVGASLGKNILFRDLKLGGKYTFIYFCLSIIIIAVSFGLGLLLSNFTTLNYTTAILGISPGGFYEMVLTAYNFGGDPAVVSSLQLVRILVIVTCVPLVLKWWFGKGKVNTD